MVPPYMVPPLTLLAIVVGVPGVSEEVFEWLDGREESETLAAALSEFPWNLDGVREIMNELAENPELTVGALQDHLPEVGRYSFRVGRMREVSAPTS